MLCQNTLAMCFCHGAFMGLVFFCVWSGHCTSVERKVISTYSALYKHQTGNGGGRWDGGKKGLKIKRSKSREMDRWDGVGGG